MWEWKGDLPTMVGILPRDGEARDVRWFKGPSRNTLHFLNASDSGNKVTMELPVSDEERSPSHIKRWTFDMNSKNDAFGERQLAIEPRHGAGKAWLIIMQPDAHHTRPDEREPLRAEESPTPGRGDPSAGKHPAH